MFDFQNKSQCEWKRQLLLTSKVIFKALQFTNRVNLCTLIFNIYIVKVEKPKDTPTSHHVLQKSCFSARLNSKGHDDDDLRRCWRLILDPFPFQPFLLLAEITVHSLFRRLAEQKRTIRVTEVYVAEVTRKPHCQWCQQQFFFFFFFEYVKTAWIMLNDYWLDLKGKTLISFKEMFCYGGQTLY